jgi:hypothetical protein
MRARTNESGVRAPLYNGFRRPGPFFRVMSPLPGGEWQHCAVSRDDARLVLRLTSHYVTQRTTWRALIAGAAIQLLLFGRQSMRRADATLVRTRPHSGRLYYERRFGVPFETFDALARPFIERRL